MGAERGAGQVADGEGKSESEGLGKVEVRRQQRQQAGANAKPGSVLGSLRPAC